MFTAKKFALVVALMLISVSQAWSLPLYNFAGSWIVGNGPDQSINPPVYSGRDAAALLFGGNATDYVISTIDSDPANINFMAYLDGFAIENEMIAMFADTYSLSSNGGGYSNDPSYSAYVLDHSCFNRYFDPAQACDGYGTQFVNFAFRSDNNNVPEPTTLALFGIALLALSAKRRHG